MERRRVLVVSLCLVFVSGLTAHAVEFAGGTGEADDPYQIATAAQLLTIEQDAALQSRHFVLIADVDMDPNVTGGEVLARGLILTTGSLDGRGYGVRNLGGHAVVSHPGFRPETVYGSALFERIGAGAIVSNLRALGTLVEIDRSNGLAILAYENAGRVVNCSVEGTVSSPKNKSPSVGLLVAKNTGAVVACHATGYIAGPNAGALVGENAGAIIDCDAAGSVVGNGSGGLVGINTGSIAHSHSICNVTGGSGLVGDNSGTIAGCYAGGDISEGFAGLVGSNGGEIRWCYATGDVQSSTKCAGGLVSGNGGTVSQCYATGRLSTEKGTGGGLVVSNSGTVRQCYATGSGGAALIANRYWGLILSCYALSPLDGGGAENGIGFLLTDAQMRRPESFMGWDFYGTQADGSLDHWTMPDGGGYPVLSVIDASGCVGSGTANDPYLIETYLHLVAVSREPGACYKMVADIDLHGESFASSIIPVFWGRFDGAGHCVSGFAFTDEKDLGFFGTLYPEATVLDLHLERVSIVLAAKGSYPEGTAVGTLAAHSFAAVVDCSASVDVSIESPSYFGNIGGLIGINEMGEIRRCSTRLTVAYPGGTSNPHLRYTGGLVGWNVGEVIQCRASSYTEGRFFASGGLVGRNDGHVTDCYADGYLSGYIEGRMPTQPVFGGMIGSNAGAVTRCYATAQIAAPGSGGLIGENQGGVIAGSYFLSEPGSGSPNNGLGLSLSDAQMKRQASFSGWDFGEVWTICEGEGYPRLRWEGAGCEP